MPVNLEHTKRLAIPLHEMKDGQICEIIEWNSYMHVGKIVQRYGTHLIEIGRPFGRWSNLFSHPHDNCYVHIIENGEHLIVTNNQ